MDTADFVKDLFEGDCASWIGLHGSCNGNNPLAQPKFHRCVAFLFTQHVRFLREDRPHAAPLSVMTDKHGKAFSYLLPRKRLQGTRGIGPRVMVGGGRPSTSFTAFTEAQQKQNVDGRPPPTMTDTDNGEMVSS
ncbi:MAG: hypothetical protein OYH76_20350 [Defluviicoccus sp.]|nr:hypothetical protein [Defluviicoccus sp.]MDE0278255.1 hypothetical protein [Defluviicoccus sp.]